MSRSSWIRKESRGLERKNWLLLMSERLDSIKQVESVEVENLLEIEREIWLRLKLALQLTPINQILCKIE